MITPIDVVFVLVVVVLSIRGAIRGFVAEILSTAAVVLGVVGAAFASMPLSRFIENQFGESIWSRIIAFLVVFLLVYLVVKLLEGVIQRGLEALSLQSLDRALGFLLGVTEGVLVVCAMLVILILQPLFDANTLIEGSLVARYVMPILGAAAGSLGLPETINV